MKRIFIYITIIAALFGCKKKEELSNAQSEVFVKYYGSFSEDYSNKMIQTDDQGFIIVGTVSSLTQQKDADDCIEIIKTTKIDWLIVDHYGIDEDWQMKLKSYCNKIMVIDDLGDRSHYCSLLLDQNIGSTFSKYKELVKKDCKLLIGPK